MKPEIILHQDDLPGGLDFANSVAVDSETRGLVHNRDRLCLVQLSAGDGVCHLVKIAAEPAPAPNLTALMENASVTKLFHYARFDVAVLKRYLNIDVNPIYCTKIASHLVRTYTDKHGLKDITRELVGVELDKEQQSSDWARNDLSDAQLKYAASDVLYLHEIRAALDAMLEREDRMELARKCFGFLPTRAALDLAGWAETDIFSH